MSETTHDPVVVQADTPVNPENPPESRFDAITRLQYADCPYCENGVCYVQTYDPEATFEQGQPLYHPQQKSGGAVYYLCGGCGKGHSVALNPDAAPVAPPR